MIVKCKYNTGKELRKYEFTDIIDDNIIGRFGMTGYTDVSYLEKGKNYLVLGIIIFDSFQAYLFDDDGCPTSKPCQLFEIIHNEIPDNWKFRISENQERELFDIHAFIGYEEFSFDIEESYHRLVVEKESTDLEIFNQKVLELKKYYREKDIDLV